MANVITFNDNGLTHNLHSSIASKVPKAVAGTLNKIAQYARADLITAERSQLHLTRNFLPSSTQYEAARSSQGASMQAEVGLLDRVHFGELLVDGGDRTPRSSKYIAVPESGKHGRNKVSKAKNTFVKTINGKHAIWQNQKKGGIKMLYKLDNPTTYNPNQLTFEQTVLMSAAKHNYEDMLGKALLKAIGLGP